MSNDFVIELKVSAEQMAEVVLDWAANVHNIHVCDAPEKTPRKANRHATRPGTKFFFRKTKSRNGLPTAVGVAANACGAADDGKANNRKFWGECVMPEMAKAGYKETGAQPAISELVSGGFLVQKKG
jgi:hypothetical protein